MAPIPELLATLPNLTTPELRARWKRIFGSDPPPKLSLDLLMRASAYQIQTDAHGGLDPKSIRRLRSLVQVFKTTGNFTFAPSPSLKPGAKLIREWHGKTHRVTVLENGFDYAGRRYRSLSQIAREITGTRWSGPSFFGLNRGPKPNRRGSEAHHG